MVKIIDIDSLFDKYIEDYVYKNIGKVKPEEIENKIPVLYTEFGKKKLEELDGKSPEEYYTGFTAEELVKALKTHIEKEIDVSDFLCEALMKIKGGEDALVKALDNENSEHFILYVMNILNDINSEKAINKYVDFVLWDYSLEIKELATEILGNFADKVKEPLLKEYKDASEEVKSLIVDVLSKASKDDRIFDILIEAFIKHQDEIPLYAGYLGRYGDERALPFLKTAIEGEKLNYADFEELRFAIESLGGECNEEKDFSSDKIYKKIKEEGNKKLF